MSSSDNISSAYSIYLENKSAMKGWGKLEQEYPEAMNTCREFLENSPYDTINSRGKVKKLKGKLKRLHQYDITEGDRIWYRVDKTTHSVYVEYAGHHP